MFVGCVMGRRYSEERDSVWVAVLTDLIVESRFYRFSVTDEKCLKMSNTITMWAVALGFTRYYIRWETLYEAALQRK